MKTFLILIFSEILMVTSGLIWLFSPVGLNKFIFGGVYWGSMLAVLLIALHAHSQKELNAKIKL